MKKLQKSKLELNDLAKVRGGDDTPPTDDENRQVGKPITIKAK